MYSDLSKFFKGKRVLLTGHTGFKGTWMALMLCRLGARVCGYSLPLSEFSFYNKVKPEIEYHVEGDIADREKIFHAIDSFNPEIIFHFASHSSLDGSDKIPEFILRTNVLGVINLLEAVRLNIQVKSMVVVTSDKCYLNQETQVPYDENSQLGAKDPYSTSKVCQEYLTACYEDSFYKEKNAGPCTATARASNVIGPGDYNITRLFPYLLDAFSSGRKAYIRNPEAVRPWQFVLDVDYGYLLLAKKLYESYGRTTEYNGAYNFGPGEDGFVKVGQVAKRLSSYLKNAEYEVKEGIAAVKKETQILKLDSHKAQAMLNWFPQYSLEETIKAVAEFQCQAQSDIEKYELSRRLIDKYFNEMK